MYKLSANVRQTRDSKAPSPHLREDGTNYPYRMFYDNNSKIIDADEMAELIEMIIPGYLQFNEDDRRAARDNYARNLGFNIKVNVLASITEEDRSNMSDWEWNVLSADAPLSEVYPLYTINAEGDKMSEFWASEKPLVLVEADYFPHTNIVAPMSALGDFEHVANLIRLRSSTEEYFLNTLAQLGLLVYGAPRVQPTGSLTY